MENGLRQGGAKSAASDCQPTFVWAKQPGYPNFLPDPKPIIGVAYQYLIEKVSDNIWVLLIMETSGLVLHDIEIRNQGMNYGSAIQVVGEVDSRDRENDMGVSGLLALRWKNDLEWFFWNGWNKGIEDFPPYRVIGVTEDPGNNVQVYGNNGNPISPDAICP